MHLSQLPYLHNEYQHSSFCKRPLESCQNEYGWLREHTLITEYSSLKKVGSNWGYNVIAFNSPGGTPRQWGRKRKNYPTHDLVFPLMFFKGRLCEQMSPIHWTKLNQEEIWSVSRPATATGGRGVGDTQRDLVLLPDLLVFSGCVCGHIDFLCACNPINVCLYRLTDEWLH